MANKKSLIASTRANLYSAFKALENTGCDKFMASGLVVTIKDLNGNEVVPAFLCADGLEQSTQRALQDQIKKTIALQDLNCPFKTGEKS